MVKPKIKVSEHLAGSQWINVMLGVVAAFPVVVRVYMLLRGWRPMVDATHALCIVATYVACLGYPIGAVIFSRFGKSKMEVFKSAFYKGILINSLIITTGRLYLSTPAQKNIFSNDLFVQHQMPRWVFAICVLSIVFSTWFEFKPALLLNAAQFVPIAYGCLLARPADRPMKPEERGRMFVELMALCIVSCVLLYNSWRGHNAIESAAMGSKLLELEQQRTRRLAAQRRADRLMNHHVKNVMAEVYASLILYAGDHGVTVTDLREAATSLKRAIVFLQKTLAIASIFDPALASEAAKNTELPQQVEELQQWLKPLAPKGAAFEGCKDQHFIFENRIVADIFTDLSFGNCVKHGAGDVRITCTFNPRSTPSPSSGTPPSNPQTTPSNPTSESNNDNNKYPSGVLRMDISNLIETEHTEDAAGTMQQQLVSFSNGLGLEDMRDVCRRLSVPFRTFSRGDHWHSVIELRARVAEPTRSADQTIRATLPEGLRVVIIDDQKMILRMCEAMLRHKFKGIEVTTFRLNDLKSYDRFCASAPRKCKNWDMLVVDQHFNMCSKDGRLVERHGTDVLQLVVDAGYQGCLVMHSGNNDAIDMATYHACGAHGTVGKGATNFSDELARIYDNFVFHRKRSKRKRSRTQGGDSDEALDLHDTQMKRSRILGRMGKK